MNRRGGAATSHPAAITSMTQTPTMFVSTIIERARSGSSDDPGTTTPLHALAEQKGVPGDAWMRCEGCGAMLFRRYVVQNFNVCPGCDHHLSMPAAERVDQLLDTGTFDEWYAELEPEDPLAFNDNKPYADRVRDEQRRTGMTEAALVGEGRIQGVKVVLGVTDGRFMRGSLGCVAGEKLTHAIEVATRRELPLVIVSGSGGGMRMHEGTFALMQMAKVSAALARHHAAGRLYISVLSSPMPGATAGFALLGDVNLSEPMTQTAITVSRRYLDPPHGFDSVRRILSSTFQQEHEHIDKVVHRRDLRHTLSMVIDYLL